MSVIAVEDCSPEASGLVADVAALHEQWKASNGEELLAVAAAAVKLALAEKSRLVNWLVILYGGDDPPAPALVPADEALDMHTWEGRRRGRGLRHFLEEGARLERWSGDVAALEADVAARANERRLRDDTRRSPPPDPQMTLTDEEKR